MTCRIEPSVVQEIAAVLANATGAMTAQRERYAAIWAGMQPDMLALQKETQELTGRVETMTDQLRGSEEAQMAMQANLQCTQRENEELKALVITNASAQASLQAQLEIAQRDIADAESTIQDQRSQLEGAARRAAVNGQWQKQFREKRSLQDELSAAQTAKQIQQSQLIHLVSFVAAIVLGLVTGGFGGVLLGYVAGRFVAQYLTQSPELPCMTPIFARLASIQTRMKLADQEMVRLEERVNA